MKDGFSIQATAKLKPYFNHETNKLLSAGMCFGAFSSSLYIVHRNVVTLNINVFVYCVTASRQSKTYIKNDSADKKKQF